MVLGRTSLGRAVLGSCCLALDRCDEVVVAPSLVTLLLLLEARGCPLTMVHDLLPLALWGVERRRDCLLAVRMVARDVKELRVLWGMRRPNRWTRKCMSCHSVTSRWRRCPLHQEARCNAWRSDGCTRASSPSASVCSFAAPTACRGKCMCLGSCRRKPNVGQPSRGSRLEASA
jgi:hypothetical protein